eukprot:TRINITY_DN38670_c0_g3_i2.p2 TRINITY_DN38670_c0_g3~~TRINITY_DN38670_c0_g3_i2.p2  ORF type:complete len:127 (+),score=36.79 TRINITY_DN38670_c0_g3_i2:484-864(+)
MICVMVLLCQAFIFENVELFGTAAGLFGGFVMSLIILCVCLNVKRVVERVLNKNLESLVIPVDALSSQLMSKETEIEVHYLHSLFLLERNGALEIHVENFLKYASKLNRNPFVSHHSAIHAALSRG